MPRLVQITFSAIPDDPRVRRHGDALRGLGWDVAGLGLTGARATGPDWPVVEIDLHEALAPKPIETPETQAVSEATLTETRTADTLEVPHRRPLWKSVARLIWFVAASPLGLLMAVIGLLLRALRHSQGDAFLMLAKIIWTDIGWPIRVYRRLKQKPLSTIEGAMEALELRRPITAMIDAGRQLGPADIWVANDWTALPVATALRDAFGGHVVYDSHEFAIEEYAQDWAWRTYERPIADKIEGTFIKEARVITAVSSGIVKALKDRYQVKADHEVVINAPPYVAQEMKPTNVPIQFLYHGVVAPGRGLEILIEAASHWKKGHKLSIRGPGQVEYLKGLEALITRHGVSDRVALLEPVAMTDLVSAARSFDVGIMALPGHSAHNRFALPNKVFEYMAAGLALCVSNLPEMAEVVQNTSCGILLPSDNPADIAASFDAMTVEQIDGYKRAALEAAKTYNGGASAATLDRLYRGVLVPRGA